MTHKKPKNLTFEKIIYTALGLYVLFVSLYMVRMSLAIWLYIFYIFVSLFSIYAPYKILYKNDSSKLLRIALLSEAIMGTCLLYPTPLAMVADFVGFECSGWYGVPEKCVDSITFLSFDSSIFIIMIPMVLLAIFAYQKTK